MESDFTEFIAVEVVSAAACAKLVLVKSTVAKTEITIFTTDFKSTDAKL